MYIRRHLRHALAKIEKMFGAVLVAGSRQVGKTTLLRSGKSGLPYITLDNPIMHAAAVNEPTTFFKNTPPPLVIDEIDLLVMEGPTLHPVEIKKSADPRPDDAAAFKARDAIPGVTRGSGCVLCLYDRVAPLAGEDVIVPISWI